MNWKTSWDALRSQTLSDNVWMPQIRGIHYLTPPLRQKMGKSKGGGLVIHFEFFPKKALKNRRLRRAFKSRQTQNIFMKGILAHLTGHSLSERSQS